MDAIEKESLLLYDICCSYGLSSSQRNRNIQCIDSMATWFKTINCSTNNYYGPMIICGSLSEGTNPFCSPSDMDIMYMLRGIRVQEHVDTTNTNQEVLQLLYTDCPEHVLLRASKTFKNKALPWILIGGIVEKDSKYLVSNSLLKVKILDTYNASSVPVSNVNDIRFFNLESGGDLRNRSFNPQAVQCLNKTTIHGPALKTGNISMSGFGSCDFVFFLRCYEWPTAAHEWIDRTRPHGWPSQDLIDQIMNDGCELVPVGRKDHPDEDVQWKLSFSRAETRLIRNFNIYQAQCYQLLQIIKPQFISSVVADSLSSYHIKTVMLHTVEQTDPKVWRKDNLAQCFMMCLSNLKRYLEDKFLPQYFIVKQNLLEPKVTGDIHQKVLEVVTDLDKRGWKCVFKCRLHRTLFWSIQETVGSIPYNVLTDVFALEGNIDLIIRYCRTLRLHMFPDNREIYNSYLINIVGFCEKPFFKPTATLPSVETARVLQLL